MSSNESIILDQILEHMRRERAPASSEADFFELFVAEQVLKDNDLSIEEIESGRTDGSRDGSFDSIYILVNGSLAFDDIDLSRLRKDIIIDVVVIQSKTTRGFSENELKKIISTSEDVFDFQKSRQALSKRYNEKVFGITQLFKKIYMTLASRFPKVNFRYIYASRGSSPNSHVQDCASDLENKIKSLFPLSTFSFNFLGASELLSLANKRPISTYSLPLAETPITSTGEIGYIALVKLSAYYGFISNSEGDLLRTLFESNVRDYQGSINVNQEIAETLRSTKAEDFWWLNNGITIVASKATQSGKILYLEDPQIVNGLQTSTEIYRFFRDSKPENEQRNLLIRVIVPTKSDSRDRVIKATNSQTSIPPASLHATDEIHRSIEEHLKPFELFYDRRKNQYKNEGKPLEKIISIPLMAQAVMSILLQRPDNARARPSSLLKKESDYSNIFSISYPIGLYRICAIVIKKIETMLRAHTDLESSDRNNLRFYVAMKLGTVITRSKKPTPEHLSKVDAVQITDEIVIECIESVVEIYKKLGGGARLAKGTKLVSALKELL